MKHFFQPAELFSANFAGVKRQFDNKNFNTIIIP